VTVKVPSTGALLITRFTGESSCAANLWCSVRILVDGNETFPNASDDSAFDENNGATWVSNSIERSTFGPLPAGPHTVRVQYAAVGGGTFRLDDWHLTVLAAQP
jgi:hypothetical protein